ncbi:MAG: alpha/beta hydrolase [Pseudomonadota bacterium]
MKTARFAVIAMAVLAVTLWGLESVQRARDDAKFPPPGHFVELGDRRLHVQCAGTSNGVTVMLEAGAGASSLDWEVVASKLSERLRVCRYDRAGHGWSDQGPKPRSIEAITLDLHRVIEEEAQANAIVLAGHSFGGLIAQAYARQHPDRLLGLVLVDAVDAEFIELYAEQSIAGARTMKVGSVVTHFGLPRLLGIAPAPESAPADVQAAMKARVIRPVNIATVADESVSVRANVEYLAVLGPIKGDLPITVVSRSTDPTIAFDRDWEAAQVRMSRLNGRTKRVVSSSTDHQLGFTDPDLVVSKILALTDDAAEQ